jgi:hypothetical protein
MIVNYPKCVRYFDDYYRSWVCPHDKSYSQPYFLIPYLICFLFLIFTPLLFTSCTSTGNPSHPVKFIGWHQLAFGHDKYTSIEAIEARCRYRNRRPDGRLTGFSRQCRIEAAKHFPMGINCAMYATGCVIERCGALAATWDDPKWAVYWDRDLKDY